MGLYAKRAMQLANYAYNSPYAKRAKTSASTYVKKKISSALSRAIEGTRGVKPSEVRSIVRRQIATSADKRQISVELSANIRRTFNSSLLCKDIIQGDSVINRSGSTIHLNAIKIKYVVTHTGDPATTPSTSKKSGLPGPVTWNMFIIQTDRTDSPRDFWYKINNEDGDRDYRFPFGGIVNDTTALGDVGRANLEFNTDDYRILASKKVTVSGCTGGSLDNTLKTGDFIFNFRTPVLFRFNNTAAQVPPWLPTDMSKRIYFVYYMSQPDGVVDDTISTASINATMSTFFTDN